MARFDAEAAWDDLQALLVTREGWGTKQLLAEMAHLRVRHRTEEALFERFVRLYGDRLLPVAETSPGGAATEDGGMPTVPQADDHRLTDDSEEDHDDRSAHHAHPRAA